jgi:uncharacterized repeat protein (TIGR01451 family)
LGALAIAPQAQDTNTPLVTLVLFNTGVNDDRSLLLDGAVDPHYQLVQSPDSAYPGPAAFVAVSSGGWPYPQWTLDGSNSKWIAPRTDVSAGNASGIYLYRTTVDLSGLDPVTAQITGQWATDNDGLDILLNGNSTGNQNFLGFNFGSFAPFTVGRGFRTGTNTLDFLVHQSGAGTPTGLRVELSGTARLPCTDCEPPKPVVSILSPTDGETLCPGTNFAVTVSANAVVGSIANVEVYAGSTRVGSASAPPYNLTVNSLKVGDYLLTARAVDMQGQESVSSAVRVVVTAACLDRIGIIASADDPQLGALQNLLLEMGLSSERVDPVALDVDRTRGWKAVLWLASRNFPGQLTASTLSVLGQATSQGLNAYYCGEGVASSLAALPEQEQMDWSNILHMQPRAISGGDGVVRFRREAPVHPVVQGIFGTGAVQDFPTTVAVGGTATADAQALAHYDGADVLAAFPADAQAGTGGERVVTQFFDVWNGADDLAWQQRKQLFENAMYWLLGWTPCSLYTLSLSSSVSGPRPVGSILTYTLQVQHEGECEATGVMVSQPLPAQVQFLDAQFSQGSCQHSSGLVTFQVGHLSSAAAAVCRIRVLAVSAGSTTNCATVSGDGFPAGMGQPSCTVLQVTPGDDPIPILGVEPTPDGLRVNLKGAAGVQYAIESSKDLKLWRPWTNAVLTASATAWMLPATGAQRFYRALTVDAASQGPSTSLRSSP